MQGRSVPNLINFDHDVKEEMRFKLLMDDDGQRTMTKAHFQHFVLKRAVN